MSNYNIKWYHNVIGQNFEGLIEDFFFFFASKKVGGFGCRQNGEKFTIVHLQIQPALYNVSYCTLILLFPHSIQYGKLGMQLNERLIKELTIAHHSLAFHRNVYQAESLKTAHPLKGSTSQWHEGPIISSHSPFERTDERQQMRWGERRRPLLFRVYLHWFWCDMKSSHLQLPQPVPVLLNHSEQKKSGDPKSPLIKSWESLQLPN